jgi:hypothetical protein
VQRLDRNHRQGPSRPAGTSCPWSCKSGPYAGADAPAGGTSRSRTVCQYVRLPAAARTPRKSASCVATVPPP